MLKRILGLDLGISSIGWGLSEIKYNENYENHNIKTGISYILK